MRKRVPPGVSLLSWATGVRWFGWGLFEALLPVFLFSFAHTYAETGLLSSIYNIAFMLSWPLAGMLADRVASKTIIVAGLLLYPFISISYFLAGVSGFALFIVIARVLNGVGYAFDSVGRDTYFRAHTPPKSIASAFGYSNTVTHFCWIGAVLLSMLIVPFVPLHWLFLAIIPTVIITIFMVLRLLPDHTEKFKDGLRKAVSGGVYIGLLREMRSWSTGLQLSAVLTFFTGFIATLAEFFIPIYAYVQGASLPQVIFISVILNIPQLFGTWLGRIADRNHVKSLLAGLGCVCLLLAVLTFSQGYLWQLVVVFGIGIVLELIDLAGDGITTHLAHPRHYGRISGAMEGLGDLGSVAGPVVLGLLLDKAGMAFTVWSLAGVVLVLGIVVYAARASFGAVAAKQ
ncbi:MAG TPA: MFS transporter [Candidatus Binatia bacterium]|nr:MFS transporter [Candidatus Binatia bacterium]